MIALRFSAAELESRRERIVDFIAAQVGNAGASGAVIGLSGGIDSTLTAALAVEALGTERLLGVSMPAAVSATEHQNHAAELADQLGIPFETVPVESIVDEVVAAAPHADVTELGRGNSRARARAVLLYLIANDENRLVLGTGNRSEALVGYFTKFGDGAVDCHPIGNLYKCQVRQLARHVDLPEEIIEKPPTAELWEDQTDEDELGIAYDTLDQVLALHIDGPFSASATAQTIDIPIETVETVGDMVAESAHKRTQPPAPPLDDH